MAVRRLQRPHRQIEEITHASALRKLPAALQRRLRPLQHLQEGQIQFDVARQSR